MTRVKQDIKSEIDFFNENKNISFPLAENQIFELTAKYLSGLEGLGLEGGCGLAFLGRKLIQNNRNISLLGVDINQNFVERINKMKLTRYKAICGDLTLKKLFPKHHFDFIFLTYVLHHIPNTKTIIENAHFWLKDHGKLIILEPNGLNPILNLSYDLRIFLQRFFYSWTTKYTSPNEKNIPLGVFNKLFDGFFEILVIEPFLISFKSDNHLHLDPLIKVLAEARRLLLQALGYLRFSEYWGSDILIIAQKRLHPSK